MPRPLGLPVGSIRALSLLGLTARAVLDVHQGRGLAPWLGAAILVCGAAYFAARAARRGLAPVPEGAAAPRERDPLGLPRGTVRFLFLAGVTYVAWAWVRAHGMEGPRAAAGLVVGGFAAGILVRWFLTQVRRPEDASTLVFEHLQAIASLVAAGGLVAFAVTGTAGTHDWIEPALAAACTYYAAVR
jgi:fermentation-respiration switch protein FrsA (DUF1100 family)